MWPWRTSTFLRWPEPDGFMGAGAGQWRRHVTTSVSLWGVKRFCSPAGATATDFVTDDEAALKWTIGRCGAGNGSAERWTAGSCRRNYGDRRDRPRRIGQ